jgi:hypothetical protein
VASWCAVKRSLSTPFLLHHNTFSLLVRYGGQRGNEDFTEKMLADIREGAIK